MANGHHHYYKAPALYYSFTVVISISGIFLAQNSLLAYYDACQVHKRAFCVLGVCHNMPKSRSRLLINIYKF